MYVALLTEFAVTKKEPLAVLLERIHAAFLTSGLGKPSILFTFSDSPVPTTARPGTVRSCCAAERQAI